jgi:hypothetical protein
MGCKNHQKPPIRFLDREHQDSLKINSQRLTTADVVEVSITSWGQQDKSVIARTGIVV